MGEIADSLINGDFDFVTGEYLGEGYGFPRTLEPLEPFSVKNKKRKKNKNKKK